MLPDDVQVISVDDHVIEHPKVWTDRLPAKHQEAGPKIVELDGGAQVWSFEGKSITTIGLNAVAGTDPKDFGIEPVRFAGMLPGISAMQSSRAHRDLQGIPARLPVHSFPAFLWSTLLP